MMYLASPYSDPDPLVRKSRYLVVKQTTELLLEKHICVFSPIVYAHELAVNERGFTSDDWWNFNREVIRHCSHLLVLDIDGLKQSKGCWQEMAFAAECGIPQSFVNTYGQYVEAPKWL